MGSKPRPPRLRVAFTEEEAREIYDRFAKQYVGQSHTLALIRKLGVWLDSRPNPRQLDLPGTEDGG